MSQTTISKGGVTATINSMGAELTSLALDGREYLWQADPAFWGKHAPVLFPIVGSLRDKQATCSQGTCRMERHGVARINEHRLVEVSEDGASATFELAETPETLEAYPYRFKLNMTYAITGPATLTQTFTVTNTGDVDLPFSVGGHPAFNVPVPGDEGEERERFEDYVIQFAEPWTCPAPKIVDGGLASYADPFTPVTDVQELPLTRDLFTYDTLTLDHVPGDTVTIKSSKSGRGVRVDFPGFDYMAIWSAAGEAPFAAIEPWTGTTTLDTEDDVLEHKRGITVIAPGETWEGSFSITML